MVDAFVGGENKLIEAWLLWKSRSVGVDMEVSLPYRLCDKEA